MQLVYVVVKKKRKEKKEHSCARALSDLHSNKLKRAVSAVGSCRPGRFCVSGNVIGPAVIGNHTVHMMDAPLVNERTFEMYF